MKQNFKNLRGRDVVLTVSVHIIQSAIIEFVRSGRSLGGFTLRALALELGFDESPQQMKHHLMELVKIGFLDLVGGVYHYPKERDILMKYKEALQWCSGSHDFSEQGQAREGWEEICQPLI